MDKIKLIATDVDGVLTRGEIIFTENGKEIKIWNVRDGLAFTILKKLGTLKIAWITGRSSQSVEDRSKEMGVHYLIQNCLIKKNALDILLRNENITKEEIAYIGDDLLDVPVLKEVGFSVCPSDGVPEAKKAAKYIAKARGGEGVFRETVELILKSQGLWEKAISLFEK
jgi:3-deoxy-D-manno-octulosonate 8-phosphate phosphatase (KDO 8-P phosphatase)